jgi:hypothetical protein
MVSMEKVLTMRDGFESNKFNFEVLCGEGRAFNGREI